MRFSRPPPPLPRRVTREARTRFVNEHRRYAPGRCPDRCFRGRTDRLHRLCARDTAACRRSADRRGRGTARSALSAGQAGSRASLDDRRTARQDLRRRNRRPHVFRSGRRRGVLGHRDAALLPARVARGVIVTGDEKRLPTTIGGLVDLAFAAYVERAPLYLGLALAAFALQAAVEFALPAWKVDTREGTIKALTLQYLAVLLDSVIIAAVALGVATRVAGKTA